ncbi:F0F1 ATP synthase subunit delta [Cellulomonas sp. CW35]|uniref:F0F1 ATP synthase subunit delta n=1 Tax=unclassified Cellulomonas TaxID=2620175 RepID=UPI000B8D2228|nr:F0F1 ATP synthase subunit delta [Cellulomonas sp. PSBB021]ASR53945.1 F0F1 ATP synthase subunit delta [Cellulomonas sp. PSBB021]
MRGTSRASLAAVEERFEPVLTAAGAQASDLGEQLFALVDALDSSGSLRRVLGDPSVDGEAKATLVGRLLAPADPRVVAVAQDAVRQRWSADADLADALERLGFIAVVARAENEHGLADVEEELFRLTRALAGQRQVRQALFDPAIPGAARADLVDRILAGRGSAVTGIIARRAASAPRGRRYVATLGRIADLIAERRSREVATVTSATDLAGPQRDRLAQILRQAYGRDVQLNVIVDPHVLGGLRIQVGPQVVDSTVLSRLADARRRLAG